MPESLNVATVQSKLSREVVYLLLRSPCLNDFIFQLSFAPAGL